MLSDAPSSGVRVLCKVLVPSVHKQLGHDRACRPRPLWTALVMQSALACRVKAEATAGAMHASGCARQNLSSSHIRKPFDIQDFQRFFEAGEAAQNQLAVLWPLDYPDVDWLAHGQNCAPWLETAHRPKQGNPCQIWSRGDCLGGDTAAGVRPYNQKPLQTLTFQRCVFVFS